MTSFFIKIPYRYQSILENYRRRCKYLLECCCRKHDVHLELVCDYIFWQKEIYKITGNNENVAKVISNYLSDGATAHISSEY